MKTNATYSVTLPLLDILGNQWAISIVALPERPHLQEFLWIDWDGGKRAHRIVQIHQGGISCFGLQGISQVALHLVLHSAQKRDYSVDELIRRGWQVLDRNILPSEV